MADTPYREQNFVFASKGIVARYADDAVPDGFYLDMDNCEELAENSVGTRLGSTIINRTGDTVFPLEDANVYSLAKLAGLNGAAWRYAGCLFSLFRITGLAQGPYSVISTTMSGQPWTGVVYRPDISSMPYIFFADMNGMLKDNGSLAAPQQMGIFQPQYPVRAVAQDPDYLDLDSYGSAASSYSYSGISGGTNINYVTTTTTEAITATGIQAVTVADPTQPGLFQLLNIDTGANSEQVLVILLESGGFVANFTKTHANGAAVVSLGLSIAVPASTTATVSKSFGGKPIAAWPTTLQQADYIGLYLYVSNPNDVQSITLKFDCGDGSFNTDFFYKVIGQGPLQALLQNVADPTTAATDAFLSESLGLYGNSAASIAQLNSGLNQWTPLLIQLSDFAGSGRADFTDPVHNWNAVNGYQITVVTNQSGSATINLSSLLLFGGAGPDSFAGVSYDWLFTFYNNVDGTESNPCMVMTNVNPPFNTNFVTPRRQPVLLTMTYPTIDPQTTSLRVYRRGGTLGDNYRRVDEILVTGSPQQYTDTSADDDIEDSDLVSFTNDVPVTSTLPTPVNTTLETAITTTNQVVSVFPISMANISARQQVDLGLVSSLANNFEVVVVLQVFSDHFTAFVQNTHVIGEPVAATAKYGQPLSIMAEAYGQMWFAGDPNNPHFLYWSAKSNPQAVSSAANIEVGTPDDPITVIVQFKGNLYVSTRKFWWAVAPGSNANASPTVYPTAAKHGCVAPFGYAATEEAIYYQAIDGWRAFAGGASSYLSQEVEFLFQGVGTSPIVQADPDQLSLTQMAYWNNMIFLSYVAVGGFRHRLIWHTIYKRFRNDDLPSFCLLLEADTNTLLFGDGLGLVRQDRVNIGYDEGIGPGDTLVHAPIDLNLIIPYKDQGLGDVEKNYNEFTIDVNTSAQTLTLTLLFNDGQFSIALGTVTTTERQKVNLPINGGDGQTAYKVALQITGAVTGQVYVYQASIKNLPLAKTRLTFDSWWLKLGTDESKLCKQIYIEYSAGSAITFDVYYDGSATSSFSFTIPEYNGVRNAIRVRLPAVKFRLIRFVAPTTPSNFQIWEDSGFDWKPICSGKGYSKAQFVPN